MERIKSYLIHLLGGITEQEHARLCMLNNLARLHSIKQKADCLYGTPPEEWCRQMYSYITDEIDNLKNSVGNEEKGGDK